MTEYDAILAETVLIAGHEGTEIAAYLARPLTPGPVPGVLVIHHMPGWDEGSKEITRKFAAHGYAAICPTCTTGKALTRAQTTHPRRRAQQAEFQTRGFSATPTVRSAPCARSRLRTARSV